MPNENLLSPEKLEEALSALEWEWLRDRHGVYTVEMAPSDEFGALRTLYEFSLAGADARILIMRLRAKSWFSGVPDEVLQACNSWNVRAVLPKAALDVDADQDSCLVLEHCIPCDEQPVAYGLIEHWVDFFRSTCSEFLSRYSEVLCRAPRYCPEQPSQTVH